MKPDNTPQPKAYSFRELPTLLMIDALQREAQGFLDFLYDHPRLKRLWIEGRYNK